MTETLRESTERQAQTLSEVGRALERQGQALDRHGQALAELLRRSAVHMTRAYAETLIGSYANSGATLVANSSMSSRSWSCGSRPL